MGLETGTYISDLDSNNPTPTDIKSQGDDHLRLIKSTLLATFPNITGAVTPTHTELNYVDGVTSNIQTQLDAITTLADGKIYVGNGSNVATEVTPTGDVTITNAGVTAIGTGVIVNDDVNASAAIAWSKLATGTASRMVVTNGSGVLTTASTGSSAGANGYVGLLGGIVLQWGSESIAADSSSAITFPTPFSTACVNVQMCSSDSLATASEGDLTFSSLSTTGVTLHNGRNGTYTIYWLAIGY